MTEQQTDRAAYIADLHSLADWLEANPDVPVHDGPHHSIHFQYSVTPYFPDYKDGCAEVARIADLLGVPVVTWDDDEAREATYRVGRAHYVAIAIRKDDR